ncbi:MAG: 2-C-methyl-D-erythritol 4-phosphate cytidylyltransferase [Pseudomonadota bacterium]
MNYTNIALLPAAGSGQRLGGSLPKQYQPLNSLPMLMHTIQALQAHPAIEHVFIVLASDDTHFESLCTPYLKHCTPLYVGASTRAASVLNGLKALPKEAENAWVFVHDAARPCLHREDIASLVKAVEQQPDFQVTNKGANKVAQLANAVTLREIDAEVVNKEAIKGFILATPVADTLKRSSMHSMHITETVSREQLWQAQTPQVCQRAVLINALEHALSSAHLAPTDEAQALEWANHQVNLVPAKHPNFKVTYRADQLLAEAVLAAR